MGWNWNLVFLAFSGLPLSIATKGFWLHLQLWEWLLNSILVLGVSMIQKRKIWENVNHQAMREDVKGMKLKKNVKYEKVCWDPTQNQISIDRYILDKERRERKERENRDSSSAKNRDSRDRKENREKDRDRDKSRKQEKSRRDETSEERRIRKEKKRKEEKKSRSEGYLGKWSHRVINLVC